MAVLAKRQMSAFGPESNGILMTPEEFDRAERSRFADDQVYELVNGVLLVSPIPSEKEADPNGELEYMLRLYRDTHPEGKCLNATLPERTIRTKRNRRRADRVIWAGLGRHPRPKEAPTIAVEFVSPGKRNRDRDYEAKRDEYMEINVQEYWIIDRIERHMTVFFRDGDKVKKRLVRENQVYQTPLLPGFELSPGKLFEFADRWTEE